jgi:DNA-binding MarR family transcriptional regulator
MGISDDTANGLGTSVVRLVKLYTAMRQFAPKVHPGADVSAYPILFHLAQGPKRVSALADCIHSDVSTVSRQVSALAVHGLVDKLADPEDRRASILTLTPAGREVIEALQQQRCQWFQSMLENWDPVEVDSLRTLLERFANAVEGSKDGLLAMHQTTVTSKEQ